MNKKGFQKLLYTLNWYSNFVKNLSRKVLLITDLLKSNKIVRLIDDMKNIIRRVAEVIRQESYLAFPDFSKPFHLKCDALERGLGE